jgi:hypothetical protein
LPRLDEHHRVELQRNEKPHAPCDELERWKDGKMVLRWAASALVSTEKNFRRILGFQSLPILIARLSEQLDRQDAGKKNVA